MVARSLTALVATVTLVAFGLSLLATGRPVSAAAGRWLSRLAWAHVLAATVFVIIRAAGGFAQHVTRVLIHFVPPAVLAYTAIIDAHAR